MQYTFITPTLFQKNISEQHSEQVSLSNDSSLNKITKRNYIAKNLH